MCYPEQRPIGANARETETVRRLVDIVAATASPGVRRRTAPRSHFLDVLWVHQAAAL